MPDMSSTALSRPMNRVVCLSTAALLAGLALPGCETAETGEATPRPVPLEVVAAEADAPIAANSPSTPVIGEAPVVGIGLEEAEPEVLADAEPILGGGAEPVRWLTAGSSEDASFADIEVADQPFEIAQQATVKRSTDPVWDVSLTTPSLPVAVAKGEVVHGSFWIRADFDGIQNESQIGSFNAFLQKPNDGWEGLANIAGQPGPRWRQMYFTAVAEKDYAPETVNFVLHLGSEPQQVAVAGLKVYKLDAGVDVAALPVNQLTYEGRDADAPWRAEAEERIDTHRRADLTIRVLDADGQPLPNADVEIELIDRAFGVGTFLSVESPKDKGGADARKWERIVRSYFNRVTCAVYPTDDWGWQSPNTRKRNLETIDWAKAEGFPVRAHVVVWPGWRWSPKAWKALADAGKGDELRQTVNDHVQEVMTELAKRDVDVVDVFNEPRVNHDIDDAVGDPSPRPEWFRIAREASPDTRLAINEFGIVSAFGKSQDNIDEYIEDIREIIDSGAPLDVIGVQGHIGEAFTAPEQLWNVLDQLSQFGLPIHVTEFDVATDDDAVQADYTRDFMTAAFAHPSVEEITFWGFWEPNHWRPKAALWNTDWSITPAGEAFVDVVENQWHTEASGTTDANGELTLRGYHGTYRVKAKDGPLGHVTRAELGPGGTTAEIRIPR